MFKLSQLNVFSREAVACSVAFERLGFEAGAIGAGVDGKGQGFVTVHHGGEQFNVVLGHLVDVSPENFVGRWREAVRSIAEGEVSEVDIAELCHKSFIWDKMEEVVVSLVVKGFLNIDDWERKLAVNSQEGAG